jgi:thiamine-monophosphate kinase
LLENIVSCSVERETGDGLGKHKTGGCNLQLDAIRGAGKTPVSGEASQERGDSVEWLDGFVDLVLRMETNLVAWLCRRLPSHPDLVIGPGDDAAVLRWGGGQDCVVTVDVLMDGVDFDLASIDPRRAGRKALAVNLSDLAAVAAVPKAAVIGLVLPRRGGEELAHQIYEGLLPLAEKYGVALAGGDVNSWSGRLVISITAIGAANPAKALRRSGAQPGDKIVVTGSFGGSILGHHLDFEPRVHEALRLADYQIHAAIDVSDGLTLDLSRIATASDCGYILVQERIPIADAAHELARRAGGGDTALRHALEDGEDFELALAVPPAEAERLLAEQPLAVPLTEIGQFTDDKRFWLTDAHGGKTLLVPRGFEHHFD